MRQVNGGGSFSPHRAGSETPELIQLKFGVFDQVRRPTHMQNTVTAAQGVTEMDKVPRVFFWFLESTYSLPR